MPALDTAPIGAPSWVDLLTTDRDRSVEFYCELFGWSAEPPNDAFGGYLNFRQDGILVAGCMTGDPSADSPSVWSIYLATDDIARTLADAEQAGGQVAVGAMAVGDLGSMAYVIDPGGAAVGVWQPGQHRGFGVFGEASAPSWFELHARDYSRAVDFYRSVFRWPTQVVSDTAEFRYTAYQEGEQWRAGIMDASALPDGAPRDWTVYFGAADTDLAVATVQKLGGAVLAEAEDTPYGRVATVADPLGVRFKLVAANDAMPARP